MTIHRRFASRDALIASLAGASWGQIHEAVEDAHPLTAPPLVALHQATASILRIRSGWSFALRQRAVDEATARFRRVTVDRTQRAVFVLIGRRTGAPAPRWVSGLRLEDITATRIADRRNVSAGGNIIDTSRKRSQPNLIFMPDVFDTYRTATAWDEMFEAPGVPRPVYRSLFATLRRLAATELRYCADQLARTFTQRGVTFAFAGEERPFPIDLVPRIIEALEWDTVVAGVRQRVATLEAFLDDVYGAGQVFADGVVPRRLITTSAHFHRQVTGIQPPNGVRVHVSGVDLIRDEAGAFRVLEDNLRVPSGVSYVIENRRAMAQTMPAMFTESPVLPIDDYPARLLAALRASAPDDVTDPHVVVLTPGVYNAAYFEHSLLARLMGVELVEGRDLECSGNQVYVRTTQGRRPVHVVYRRIDDEFLDPLQFRADSVIGCPGIVNAARAGRVTIANALGNGVADDKLLYTYVPDLIRYYLRAEPILDNVETFRLDEPGVLDGVLDSLDSLVLKPVDGSGGHGIVIGPAADAQTLATLRSTVRANPRGWIAQRPVALSTSPTLVGDRIAPRHVDLRPFAVNDGGDVWLIPGGLTRVALGEGQLVVNSSQGGGSKDTWVLAEADRASAVTARNRRIWSGTATMTGGDDGDRGDGGDGDAGTGRGVVVAGGGPGTGLGVVVAGGVPGLDGVGLDGGNGSGGTGGSGGNGGGDGVAGHRPIAGRPRSGVPRDAGPAVCQIEQQQQGGDHA